MATDNNQAQSIAQQIELDSDLYQPAVYELLSFYHALENQSEPLDGQFIPLTTVPQRSPSEVKIFAVGLIPPSSRVTGRILDRTASVQALDGSYGTIISNNPDVGSSSTGDTPGQTSGVATSTTVPTGPTSTNSLEFWDQYVAMCNRLGCQPEELAKVIQSESGFDGSVPAIRKGKDGQPHVVAKGLNQLTKKTALGLGMTEDQYNNFENTDNTSQLFWVEKYYQGRARGKNASELKAITFGGFNNPDGSIYSSNAAPPSYKQSDFQKLAYEQNRNLDVPHYKGFITPADLDQRVAKNSLNPKFQAAIDSAKSRLGEQPSSEADPVGSDAVTTTQESWQARGEFNAQESSRNAALVQYKTLNQQNLGKKFLDQQEATIRMMQDALNTMAKTPPLRLLVNPQSFRVQANKHIADGSWSRSGPIIEHWGEDQDKIEGSGKVAAFYSMDALNANGPGLTRTARQFSASYQNLLSLWLLYKNNGGVWFPDPLSPKGAKVKNLSVVGSVYLYYDDILYIGSFDTFSLTESETTPFSLEYSFSFTVRAWYLLDHLDDAQYTYGQSTVAALPTGTTNSPTFGGNNAQPSPSVAPPPDALGNLNDPNNLLG
jgi:hypothetical protein